MCLEKWNSRIGNNLITKPGKLNKFCTQRGAQAPDQEIKRLILYQLSWEGAPSLLKTGEKEIGNTYS